MSRSGLNELKHTYPKTLPPGAQEQAHCCGCFAFALASSDDHPPFFDHRLCSLATSFMAGALARQPFLFAECQILFGVTSTAVLLVFFFRPAHPRLPLSKLLTRPPLFLSPYPSDL